MCIHFNIWYIYIENGMAKNEQYTATLWIEWNIYQKSTASSELINSSYMAADGRIGKHSSAHAHVYSLKISKDVTVGMLIWALSAEHSMIIRDNGESNRVTTST